MPPELIETLLVTADRQIPLLARHLARLESSCQTLGYTWPGELLRATLQAATRDLSASGPHRVRLLLDRAGRHSVQAAVLPPLPAGQRLMLAPVPLDEREPLLRYKTTHRPWYAPAADWLPAHPDVFDLLYINRRGELCEGSRSNVYVLRHGVWYTPPLESGCLPGVQRAELLATGRAAERVLTLEDLRGAQGIRLSNALRGWFDVVLQP